MDEMNKLVMVLLFYIPIVLFWSIFAWIAWNQIVPFITIFSRMSYWDMFVFLFVLGIPYAWHEIIKED